MAITINGSGITSSEIADGTIVNADINSSAAIAQSKTASLVGGDLPTGSVLQVVSQPSSVLSTSSTSFVDMYSATITPSSTSSKVLVMVTNHIYVTAYTGGEWRGAQIKLLRDTTTIHDGGNYGTASHLGSSTDTYMTYSNFHLLDSPSTTSATTYKLQGKSKVSDVIVFNNDSYSDGGAITLMEIAG